MSKTALSLRLLLKLSNGALYKKNELAEYLEVTERKLIELRYDLIDSGFYIETISGPNGGYKLDKNRSRMVSLLNISNEEMNSLMFYHKTLFNDSSSHYKNLSNIVDKFEVLKQSNEFEYQIIKPIHHNRLIDQENANFEIIHKAIQLSHKIKFSYKKIDASIKEYTMNPYELFFYKGYWYLITYNEKYQKAYQYKLVRMGQIEILTEKYEKSPQFKLCDFTGNTSIFKDELYYLELEIRPPHSVLVSELSLSKDQDIISKDDGSIIFKGTMEGKKEIIAWLLSLGDSVNILSPEVIKEAYLDTLKTMFDRHFK